VSQKPIPPATVWQPIEVAPGAGPLGVYVLADPDALLDTMDQTSFAASDDRMPYYALLWPAGESLAAAVAEGPDLASRAVLDLGSGAGAVAFAAARRGARVTALDWAPEAEPLLRAGAAHLGLTIPRVVVCDWRKAPEDLGRFDLILAADVLYEARNAEPVARFLAAHLTDGGEAWLADPGRLHAEAFHDVAAAHGLRLLGARLLPPRVHGVTVTLTRFGRGQKQGSHPFPQ
jgi:predicted nicotinamide N-methyase